MKCVLRPELSQNYVKNMDLDVNKNIIILHMKNSDILVVSRIPSKDITMIVERI